MKITLKMVKKAAEELRGFAYEGIEEWALLLAAQKALIAAHPKWSVEPLPDTPTYTTCSLPSVGWLLRVGSLRDDA